jgi:hypothetical protein
MRKLCLLAVLFFCGLTVSYAHCQQPSPVGVWRFHDIDWENLSSAGKPAFAHVVFMRFLTNGSVEMITVGLSRSHAGDSLSCGAGCEVSRGTWVQSNGKLKIALKLGYIDGVKLDNPKNQCAEVKDTVRFSGNTLMFEDGGRFVRSPDNESDLAKVLRRVRNADPPSVCKIHP